MLFFQSDKIMEACYLSQWYKLEKRSGRSLLLLMERAKRPLVIQLYNIVFISLESLAVVSVLLMMTFTHNNTYILFQIVRWSYSLFALIKARYS